MSLEHAQQKLGISHIMLNKVVNLNFNQENLKEVLEKIVISIADHMDNTTRVLQERSEQMSMVNVELKEIKSKQRDMAIRVETQSDRQTQMNEILTAARKQLQTLNSQTSQQLIDLKSTMEQAQSLTSQVTTLKSQQSHLSSKVSAFETLADIGASGSIANLSQFMNQVNELYLTKELFSDKWKEFQNFKEITNEKLTHLFSLNPKFIETQFKEVYARIIPLEEHVRSKIDADLFDDEIDKIKTLIVNHQAQLTQQPIRIEQIAERTIKQKELMSIKEKVKKIDECLIACINFEKRLDQFQGINQKMEDFTKIEPLLMKRKEFDDLDIKIEHQRLNMIKIDSFMSKSKDRNKEYQARLDELQTTTESHDSWLRRLREQIDEIKTQTAIIGKAIPSKQQKTGFGYTFEDKSEIEEKIKEIDDELKNLKELLKTKVNYLESIANQTQKLVGQKVDHEDFKQLKESGPVKISPQMTQQLNEVFADKQSVKQNLDKVEKSINTLHIVIEQLTQGKRFNNDDDAMTYKKGFQCLSCDKNLVNVQGSPSDYYAWQKLPIKEPGDRIARLGKGFSKILGNLRLEKIQLQQSSQINPAQLDGKPNDEDLKLDYINSYGIQMSSQSKRVTNMMMKPSTSQGSLKTQRPLIINTSDEPLLQSLQPHYQHHVIPQTARHTLQQTLPLSNFHRTKIEAPQLQKTQQKLNKITKMRQLHSQERTNTAGANMISQNQQNGRFEARPIISVDVKDPSVNDQMK